MNENNQQNKVNNKSVLDPPKKRGRKKKVVPDLTQTDIPNIMIEEDKEIKRKN